MQKFIYKGPVLEFDRCIIRCWEGVTYAVSPEKARCNLAFQFKRDYNRTANSQISLPGELIAVEKEDA